MCYLNQLRNISRPESRNDKDTSRQRGKIFDSKTKENSFGQCLCRGIHEMICWDLNRHLLIQRLQI